MAELMRSIAEIVGTSVKPDDPAPFVPQVEVIPSLVERFLSAADGQYARTQEQLRHTADALEAKAAELRRRADQLAHDHNYLEDTIKKAVAYEENCRHVAQSLSLVRTVQGE